MTRLTLHTKLLLGSVLHLRIGLVGVQTSPRSPTSPFSRTSMSSQQESLPASPRPPPPLAPALEPELQDMWGAAVPALLHLQLPSGNLPSSLGNESDK